MKLRSIPSCALVCALLAACASPGSVPTEPASYSATSTPPVGAALEWDPIEPVNRAFFAFNNGLDIVLIEPAAKGWRFVLRDPGLRAVDRFFTNLEFPIRFVGNLLQLEISHTGQEVGRFAVNTTIGILGFFDPATRFGIGLYEEDTGQALGHYGLPPGPYFMVPILGPSNPRDFVTGFVDSATLGPASIARSTVGLLNTRALYIDEIREAKQASLDYYSFVRNAYVTTREARVRNVDPDQTKPNTDDLYEIEEDEETPEKGEEQP
jgi:phospholipid-binding lipoprotein MlaA